MTKKKQFGYDLNKIVLLVMSIAVISLAVLQFQDWNDERKKEDRLAEERMLDQIRFNASQNTYNQLSDAILKQLLETGRLTLVVGNQTLELAIVSVT